VVTPCFAVVKIWCLMYYSAKAFWGCMHGLAVRSKICEIELRDYNGFKIFCFVLKAS
jgi:hypothetical protein